MQPLAGGVNDRALMGTGDLVLAPERKASELSSQEAMEKKTEDMVADAIERFDHMVDTAKNS